MQTGFGASPDRLAPSGRAISRLLPPPLFLLRCAGFAGGSIDRSSWPSPAPHQHSPTRSPSPRMAVATACTSGPHDLVASCPTQSTPRWSYHEGSTLHGATARPNMCSRCARAALPRADKDFAKPVQPLLIARLDNADSQPLLERVSAALPGPRTTAMSSPATPTTPSRRAAYWILAAVAGFSAIWRWGRSSCVRCAIRSRRPSLIALGCSTGNGLSCSPRRDFSSFGVALAFSIAYPRRQRPTVLPPHRSEPANFRLLSRSPGSVLAARWRYTG